MSELPTTQDDPPGPPSPDLVHLPKFDALREWIDKLEAFVTALHKDWEEKCEQADRDYDDKVRLESELDEARVLADAYTELRQGLEDIPRGIRTLDEVMEMLHVPAE